MMIREFIRVVYTSLTARFIRYYRIGIVLILILAAIVANGWWNNANKQGNIYLRSLNLDVTIKVLEIKATGNHGYGVIYGKVIKSNKPLVYNALYHNQYIFFKIKNHRALFVSAYYVMRKNDSVVIHSAAAKYCIYRNGKLVSEYNLTSTTDPFLYADLERNKYLEFSSYRE